MAYKALYRRYRPTNFDEVMGQTYIIQTIKNSIKNDKIGHAYIFSGPRGIGKTTIARIVAKAVNCPNEQDGNPCNNDNCPVCKQINDGSAIDVVEIDAASNNGVEEMRNLLEKVNFLPAEFKYKIYIIDEVHMLSISAFNALLKTLEEPPVHVIFILATTEPHRVPATILSRCQRFDFKPLSNSEIKEQLTKIKNLENIEISNEALEVVADAADGGMRDALSILDQVSSYSSEEITPEDVNNVTGRVPADDLLGLLKYISTQEVSKALDKVNYILNTGKEVGILVQSLLSLCRDLILFQSVMSSDNKIFEKPLFIELSESIKRVKLFKYVDVLNDIQNKIKYTNTPKIYLEVGVVKMASSDAPQQVVTSGNVDLTEVYDKLYQLEHDIKNAPKESNNADFGEFKDFTKSKLDFLEEMVSKCMVPPKDLEERIEILEENSFGNEIENRLKALEQGTPHEASVVQQEDSIGLDKYNLLVERLNKLEQEINSNNENVTQGSDTNEFSLRLDDVEAKLNGVIPSILDKRYDELVERLNKFEQTGVKPSENIYVQPQLDFEQNNELDEIRLQLEAYQNTFVTFDALNEKLASLNTTVESGSYNIDVVDIYNRLQAIEEKLNNIKEVPASEVPQEEAATVSLDADDFFNTVSDTPYENISEVDKLRENYISLFTKVNDLQQDISAQKAELNENIAAVITLREKVDSINPNTLSEEALKEIENKVSQVKEYSLKVGARLTALEENVKNIKLEAPKSQTSVEQPKPVVEKPVVEPAKVEEKQELPEDQNDDTQRAYDIKIIETILHQSRDRRNMDDKDKILSVWNRMPSLVPQNYMGVAQTLSEGRVVVNGANYLIIVYDKPSICNYLMTANHHYEAKQVIKTTIQRDYDFIALPLSDWNEKSREYKEQYHMGIKFPSLTPINNPELKVINIQNKETLQTVSSQNYDKARQIFGQSLIKEVK